METPNARPLPPGLLTNPLCEPTRELAKTGDFYTHLKNMHREFGDVVSLSPNLFLFASPEMVKEGLKESEDFRRDESIETFKILVGDGLFSASGVIYDRQEKVIKSAFGRKYFTEFRCAIEQDMTELMLPRFAEAASSGREIDLIPLAVDLTMSIAARAFLGVGGEHELARKFRNGLVLTQDWFAKKQAVEFAGPMLRYSEEQFVRFPILRSLQRFVFRKVTDAREMLAAVEEWKTYVRDSEPEMHRIVASMRDVCAQLIELRRRDKHAAEKSDVLSTLLRLQGDPGNDWLNDEMIIDQVATFFVAGHETTSDLFTVLFWNHARGQTPSAVVAELSGAENLLEDERVLFQRFPTTFSYISDVLLDHSPVPFTVRRTNREMEVGGFRIPKDAQILLSPFVTRDIGVIFGFGRRQCLGRMFALEEAVMGLHRLAPVKLRLRDPSQELKMTRGLTIGYSRDSTPLFARCEG